MLADHHRCVSLRVLDSGKIVNANAPSHPDLFRAMKGGGNDIALLIAHLLYINENLGIP